MERNWQIAKINLRHNIPLHILVCLVILGLSPFLMGTANLGAQDTAKVLEMYVALIGIVMAVPIFLPEQSRDIRDLVNTKYTHSAFVYLIRLFVNMLILSLFLLAYVLVLHGSNCVFPAVRYFLGTYAEMLFFGGLGIFFYGLCDNLVIGYMIPIVYYIAAMGGGNKYMKLFYPFSMATGSYREKFVLFVSAIVLIAAGIALRCWRKTFPFGH